MKRKIGTALDEELLSQAKLLAVQKGCPLNEIIEEALKRYIVQRSLDATGSIVDATAGTYKVTPRELAWAMEEDPYGVE